MHLEKKQKKTPIRKDTWSPMFIAQFTIFKVHKQFTQTSTDEWIKKVWCVYIHIHAYNGILLSHKKKEVLPFAATWVDMEGTMLSEISQKEG